MKILVTGGSGYVGTNLVLGLLNLEHEVVVLDNMTYGDHVSAFSKIRVIKGDIRDVKVIKKALKDIEVVYHLAAISNDPTGNLNPRLTIEINRDATFNLLNECQKSSTLKRFIYASSSSVFGIQPEIDVTEEIEPKPITIYSKTKLEAEKEVLRQDKFCSVAIRPATICGCSLRQRFDLIVNALCGSAFFDKNISVFGPTQRRPNITMNDIINVYLLLLVVPEDKIANQVFNAGWENSTILQLAQKVNKYFGVHIDVQETKDNRDYYICSNKIQKVLNYKPKYTIENAILLLRNQMKLGFYKYYKDADYNNILKLKATKYE